MIIPVVSTKDSLFGNQLIVSRWLRTAEYKEGHTPTDYVNIRKTEAPSRPSGSAEAHHRRPAQDILQASFPGPSDAMLGPGGICEDDIEQGVSLLGRREPQDMEQRLALRRRGTPGECSWQFDSANVRQLQSKRDQLSHRLRLSRGKAH